ncbi:MAG: CCA tRNA nucleotidyltransferase [Candidatus Tenebribacter burtonii]|jgi:poly(A) polymerase|nr:CCA tRNA nucleotidyltransferase [Candidatus Tenebribacter burtonii]
MNKVIVIIANAIRQTEFENNTFIAGGFVRDKIMKKKSNDLDIVVSLPNGGINLAQFLFKKGISSRPVIFYRFGTAQLVISGHKIEFVMTRKESYRDKSRKPDVIQGTITEDIYRRDFTMNSLIMNVMDNKIQDITNKGIDDIKAKIIRATSQPNIIFEEDPLRMLRAVRFAVQLDFIIEESTMNGIIRNAKMIENISRERIRDELIKILLSPAPAGGIRILVQTGIMQYIIPEIVLLNGAQQNKYHDKDMLEHSLQVLQNTPEDIVLRLSALLHDIAKPQTRTEDKKGVHFYRHEIASAKRAQKILNHLKFPKETITKVCKLIKNHMRLKAFGDTLKNFSDVAVRRLIFQMDSELEPLLSLIHADNISHAKDYNLPNQIPNLKLRITSNLKKINGKKLPVTGRDIMLHFEMSEGQNIGRILDKAYEIWLMHPLWNKTEILKEIRLGEELWKKKK